MQKQVFPIIGDEKELPFYIVGIGIECWQFPINRPYGYEFPQLLVTREGEGEMTVNGETVRLQPDTVIFLPKDVPHEYHSLSESWILNWVCFSGAQAEPLLEKWGLNKFGIYPSADTERMHKIMSSAYYTIKSDRIYGNHYASAKLYDLLIEFRKIADNRQSELSSTNTAALADVLEYIENNYAQPIKLGELAEIADITEQHLCRLFKRNFHLRPMEYLAKVRIQHAKEMLVYSEKTIAEIAEASGFPDSSYFSATFKRYENVTPGEYRVRI
ncbi:MAG: AraC family transcriptional regulator [Oscillospiraceae bacterium]